MLDFKSSMLKLIWFVLLQISSLLEVDLSTLYLVMDQGEKVAKIKMFDSLHGILGISCIQSGVRCFNKIYFCLSLFTMIV